MEVAGAAGEVFKVIVMVFDVAGEPVTQGAFDVITQLMISLLASEAVV